MVLSKLGQTETKSGERVAMSKRVESISIDTGVVLVETEKSRFRVTRLHGSERTKNVGFNYSIHILGVRE